VPFEPPSLVSSLAIDEGCQDALRAAAEDDGRRGILDRQVGGSLQ
jgi:hypothetical protein